MLPYTRNYSSLLKINITTTDVEFISRSTKVSR